MEWLLKIVEGPMNGAEIALVEGLRVRVGSGADCDIVLADASLPETAFELDVSADSVSLVRGDDVRSLVPFEIFEFGTSAFAIGPAEGVWEPLKKASSVDAESSPHQNEADASESASPAKTGLGAPVKGGDSVAIADAESSPRQWTSAFRNHQVLISCCGAFVVLLVVVVVCFLCPKIAEKCRVSENSVPIETRTTLTDIARQYGLVLTNYTVSSPGCPLSSVNYPLLTGNLARKTERMAIRSLALSEDPHVRLELTDDETLLAAASELLFVVTEGAIKVVSASNRVVTLAGYAPSVSSLERTIRALDADVKGIERVVTTGVSVGGPAPAVPVAAGAPKSAAVFPETRPVKKAPRARGTAPASPVRDYPIAGILTKPYPMVVMNNGMRLVEGAQIADVTVIRIEADRLILKSGSTTFEWKP